jgi:hypothetical protein
MTHRSVTQKVATSTSNSPLMASENKKRITYTLYRDLKLSCEFFQYYDCRIGPLGGGCKPLFAEMQQKGILDFFPHISTNLKIVIIGDSVGRQLW